MHHAELMRCTQTAQHCLGDIDHLLQRHARMRFEVLFQITAMHHLHDQGHVTVIFKQGEKRHHIGVHQLRMHARLAAEALLQILILQQMGMQHLDRHLAMQLLVHGPIDHAHTALAKLGIEAIRPEVFLFVCRHGLYPSRNGKAGTMTSRPRSSCPQRSLPYLPTSLSPYVPSVARRSNGAR